ncbi:hypothetical protein Tco_0470931 [Tanacetum coccineum]
MLRRKVGEALRRKGCDVSFLRWSTDISNYKENCQKRANTDTRNGKEYKEQRFKAKVKESQIQSTSGVNRSHS